jgi:Tfp pilus assembly protein PilF
MLIELGIAAVLAAGLVVVARRHVRSGALAEIPSTYVGSAKCASCHAGEAARWRGSHHDLAMRVASDSTVAGDFDSTRFTSAGVTTTFSRQRDKFVVRTDGPDGRMHDYDVRYTFGVAPLQQYLIELPGGRLQALGVAWDARPRSAGGQRWFHLYPNQRVTHDDPLHWTGIRQNWNYMCADCHSTGVKKGYDTTTHSFAASFAAVNVACEACHGPGSRHVTSNGTTNLASLTRSNQVESCARCHSRRGQFADDDPRDRVLGDAYRVALLDNQLYYADGQIRDEVFEYGSFVQSKMYSKGVVCSDCHDPHTGSLKAAGSKVCATCHSPQKYDAPAHTFHARGSTAVDCIGCHMPTTTYMVVHARHDHSIRVPRPDLSVSIGVPNACTKCHSDKSAVWAMTYVGKWYGHVPQSFQRYADAFAASARGDSAAERLLTVVARDTAQPAIARASAVQRLASYLDGSLGGAFDVVRAGLADRSPLVRRAAVGAIGESDSLSRARLLPSMLSDSVRAVRIEAARALAGIAPTRLDEYVASETYNADRPESRLNLSLFFMARRQFADAEQQLRAALEIEPKFVPALVNLADLFRATDREAESERPLRLAVSLDSLSAAAHHALGLFFVRQKRIGDAVPELTRAARLSPDDARYGVVAALALDEAGRRDEARSVLVNVVTRHPFDRDALSLLVEHLVQRGNREEALPFARRLAALEPKNAKLSELVVQLEGRGNSEKR